MWKHVKYVGCGPYATSPAVKGLRNWPIEIWRAGMWIGQNM
jgi:hypothetical protein